HRRASGLRTGRGRLRLSLRRGCDDELMVATLAADRLADVLAPDAQALLTAWAAHDDPILPGPGLDRSTGPALVRLRWLRCDRRRLVRLERLIALLATDRLADVNPPDFQLSRTVGANGDEMRLDVAHGRSFPCERADRRPISP